MTLSFRNITLLRIALVVAGFLYWATPLLGHGGLPINVFLKENRQLFIGPSFESGPFTQFDGVILSDLPGIAVLSPGNLIPDGTALGIDVLSGIAFWNGSEIESTNANLQIHSPTIDGFGHEHDSPIDAYVVKGSTAFQTGMRWGIYDGVVPGWDSHGMFFLSPFNTLIGVYGVVLQITSPGLLPTDPFLVPFAYDPTGLGELSVEEYESGIIALTEWAQSTQSPMQAGDANQDFAFDEADLIEVFQAGKYRTGESASWSDGDWNGAPGGRIGLPPIGDALFNESDLIAAFQNGLYRTGNYSVDGAQTKNIPEPSSWTLTMTSIIGAYVLRCALHRSPRYGLSHGN